MGDLFEIESTFSFNKESLVVGSEYDYVTRTSQNQGILHKTGFVNGKNLNSAGNWSLGLLQMDFFYRCRPWYAGQFVRKIIPKIGLNKESILFFTVILNQQKKKLLSVLVRDVNKIFINLKVNLPIRDGKIDFEFMESFIAELEVARIAELENYLSAAGLKDYKLTSEEKYNLEKLANDKVEWSEYRIDDLFEKIITSDVLNNDTGSLPATTAVLSNNQIGRYISRNNATILKNVFSATANGSGRAFYQPKEFTVLQDSYAFKFKNENVEIKKIHFFVIASLNKVFTKYNWGNKSGWNKVKKEKIQLPVRDGKIDFKFMESFTTAIQKTAIGDVVSFVDKKIEAHEYVIERD